MTYVAPYIDAAGLHIPQYADIEAYLVTEAQTIFGADIYLGNDSQDYQMLTAVALALYNTMLTAQYAYNSRSPGTATGAGLDGLVVLNGLMRNASSYSTATVTITGTPYTVITNGVAKDTSGNLWNLPPSVTIGSGGTVSATVSAQAIGSTAATASQISIIQTPTYGWTAITNPVAAFPGLPVETDSQLKSRQAASVANPSHALVPGILGGVLAVSGVSQAAIYENDTGAALSTINGAYNPSGFPAHSVTLVVNGGSGTAIAQAIYARKTPGAYTNGDQVYSVPDQYNITTPIRFYLPSLVYIDVSITITALPHYTSAIGTALIAAVVSYLNTLNIGQNVVISELWQAALSVNTGQAYPYLSLTALTANIHGTGHTPGTADIAVNYNQLVQTLNAYVTITVH